MHWASRVIGVRIISRGKSSSPWLIIAGQGWREQRRKRALTTPNPAPGAPCELTELEEGSVLSTVPAGYPLSPWQPGWEKAPGSLQNDNSPSCNPFLPQSRLSLGKIFSRWPFTNPSEVYTWLKMNHHECLPVQMMEVKVNWFLHWNHEQF